MATSVFDLYAIGIGPSSSHTVGPMRAACRFVRQLQMQNRLSEGNRITVQLYGSLALTGKGHCTDSALLLGLSGLLPEKVDPKKGEKAVKAIRSRQTLSLMGEHTIDFQEERDLIFHRDRTLPFHSNALRFSYFDASGHLLSEEVFYSTGGGFIFSHQEIAGDQEALSAKKVPYPYTSADTLLAWGKETGLRLDQLILENEKTWRGNKEIKEEIDVRWQIMQECVKKGCSTFGVLPGGLHVHRRAGDLHKKITRKENKDPLKAMRYVSMWALAVSEENAAGGRIVTAPTNGSAGVIPAVLHYYIHFCEGDRAGIKTFFLVAGAIGLLFKGRASISGAEMGCMGEVGVSCAMAAAGLTAALGGRNEQVEHAAEIGMEHNLGMTCDPIKGLVQIPCIERNAVGAVQAIHASLMSLEGHGKHRVTLDQVIRTMRQTGNDMKSIYKETSLGGLAVNVPEC